MALSWIINNSVQLYENYLWTLTFADKRVEGWLLMSSPLYTLVLALMYLVIVIVGPSLMHSYEAFKMRSLLVVYNFCMTALNFYIAAELTYCAIRSGYSWWCQPVNYSNDPYEVRIAAALWWFYISKMFEFFDSFFFILRKKNRQLTFLHCYHHSTMFCLWWIGVKWVAGGSATFCALLNSAVHVPMYLYYGLTAAFPNANLWWKKYLTALQLVQFCLAIVQTVYGLWVECPFPRWMGYTLIVYMISFIILFTNFWLHAYATGRMKKSATAKKKREADGVVTNGFRKGDGDMPKNGYIHQHANDGESQLRYRS